MKTAAIIGLGLIGGSLAKALSATNKYRVIGCDNNKTVCKMALEDNSVLEICSPEQAVNADIILIALYKSAAIEFVCEFSDKIKKGAVVTDVCGVKRDICSVLEPLAKKHGFFFAGGHPMAGKEMGGYENSSRELFKNASYILTPKNPESEEITVIKDMIKDIGGVVKITTPEEHDRIIAFTSQLPHVLAASYVKSPSCLKHKGFSAGSYKDVSRVASINEKMWSELFISNKKALTEEIETLISNLKELKDAIADENAETVLKILKESKNIKASAD